MRIYSVGKRSYRITFNEDENKQLIEIRNANKLSKIKTVKEFIQWGFNYYFNSTKD